MAGGCCNDNSHCKNVTEPDHAQQILNRTSHLRSVLRSELTGTKLESYWVGDPIAALSNRAEGGMLSLFTPDNVHMTGTGYEYLAESVIDSLSKASAKKDTADVIITGTKRSYYWRGFSSERGATRMGSSSALMKSRGVGAGRMGGCGRSFHPYRGGRRN